MKITKKQLTVYDIIMLYNMSELIIPDYQRDNDAWSIRQKQDLIESILLDYDLPKFYLNKLKDEIELADGQQRLFAIMDFYAGVFALHKECKITEVASTKFLDLTLDYKEKLNRYLLDVATVSDASESEIKHMFLRLNHGSPLNAAEKRRAEEGVIVQTVALLSKHPFFTLFNAKNKRCKYEDFAVKALTAVFFEGFTSSAEKKVQKFYKNNRSLSMDDLREVKSLLNAIVRVFKGRSPKFLPHDSVTIPLLFKILRKEYATAGKETEIANAYFAFIKHTLTDTSSTFKHLARNESGVLERVQMIKDFIVAHVPLEKKDSKRAYDHLEKVVLYDEAGGECQLTGEQVAFDKATVDHIEPHSKGGETTLKNGQIATGAANSSKGNK